MKFILTLATIISSFSVQAQSIRSQCENAYYATGYVKLHQYNVEVVWEKISDSSHIKFENIIFDNFQVLSTIELEGKTIYTIKESSTSDPTGYEILLENLKTIPTQVSCTYDI